MRDRYESPLGSRYASEEMLRLFSPDTRFSTWRRLWVSLARAEHTLGLPVSQEQVDELAAHVTDIDYEAADAREKIVRHDVMAHIYAYGLACPQAAGVIHLGATSCFVTDNADLILIRDALLLVRKRRARGARRALFVCRAHKSHPYRRVHALSGRAAGNDRPPGVSLDAGFVP